MTLEEFETRCRPAAEDLIDRLTRDVSSWRDWDAMAPTLWPWIVRGLLHRFPWERDQR